MEYVISPLTLLYLASMCQAYLMSMRIGSKDIYFNDTLSTDFIDCLSNKYKQCVANYRYEFGYWTKGYVYEVTPSSSQDQISESAVYRCKSSNKYTVVGPSLVKDRVICEIVFANTCPYNIYNRNIHFAAIFWNLTSDYIFSNFIRNCSTGCSSSTQLTLYAKSISYDMYKESCVDGETFSKADPTPIYKPYSTLREQNIFLTKTNKTQSLNSTELITTRNSEEINTYVAISISVSLVLVLAICLILIICIKRRYNRFKITRKIPQPDQTDAIENPDNDMQDNKSISVCGRRKDNQDGVDYSTVYQNEDNYQSLGQLKHSNSAVDIAMFGGRQNVCGGSRGIVSSYVNMIGDVNHNTRLNCEQKKIKDPHDNGHHHLHSKLVSSYSIDNLTFGDSSHGTVNYGYASYKENISADKTIEVSPGANLIRDELGYTKIMKNGKS